MREIKDLKNSEYEHFTRSVMLYAFMIFLYACHYYNSILWAPTLQNRETLK